MICWDEYNNYCYRDGEYWSNEKKDFVKSTYEEYQRLFKISK